MPTPSTVALSTRGPNIQASEHASTHDFLRVTLPRSESNGGLAHLLAKFEAMGASPSVEHKQDPSSDIDHPPVTGPAPTSIPVTEPEQAPQAPAPALKRRGAMMSYREPKTIGNYALSTPPLLSAPSFIATPHPSPSIPERILTEAIPTATSIPASPSKDDESVQRKNSVVAERRRLFERDSQSGKSATSAAPTIKSEPKSTSSSKPPSLLDRGKKSSIPSLPRLEHGLLSLDALSSSIDAPDLSPIQRKDEHDSPFDSIFSFDNIQHPEYLPKPLKSATQSPPRTDRISPAVERRETGSPILLSMIPKSIQRKPVPQATMTTVDKGSPWGPPPAYEQIFPTRASPYRAAKPAGTLSDTGKPNKKTLIPSPKSRSDVPSARNENLNTAPAPLRTERASRFDTKSPPVPISFRHEEVHQTPRDSVSQPKIPSSATSHPRQLKDRIGIFESLSSSRENVGLRGIPKVASSPALQRNAAPKSPSHDDKDQSRFQDNWWNKPTSRIQNRLRVPARTSGAESPNIAENGANRLRYSKPSKSGASQYAPSMNSPSPGITRVQRNGFNVDGEAGPCVYQPSAPSGYQEAPENDGVAILPKLGLNDKDRQPSGHRILGRRWISRTNGPLVAKVNCALEHPKPVRAGEMRRLASICKDKVVGWKLRSQTE
ncbi:hypothetical protein PT974_03298 [Cladobotryum mycophilum]|uniref:Uncharacterized protein n=1 Tax=Cladobotryum mycophilum TaxID=491253 RepID=A0ABR0ST26_9HYPO